MRVFESSSGLSIALLIGALIGCAQPGTVKRTQMEAVPGWIAVVWNGRAQISFTDSLQTTYKVGAPDSVLNRAGGVVALNGRRVRIWGTAISGDSLSVWKIVPDSAGR
jgi:hypothetical protein